MDAKLQYSHAAISSWSIKPNEVDPNIYGYHRSVVIIKGMRNWYFQLQDGRDRFCQKFGARPGEKVYG